MTPRLSVGIPAYDRPDELDRAIRSVLAQDLVDVEVIVSDDASPDPGVARTGERLAHEDARVRFTRQPVNLGHARNYRWVLEQARAPYFMWLSDDDWLDPEYARRCIEELRHDDRLALVCGLARYHRDGEHLITERPVELTGGRPAARVLRYFLRVNMNGPLFGVARREDLLVTPFRDVLGGDWLLVAGMAARGGVRTLPDVHIHRSMTGLGADGERLARSFGVEGLLARQHHLRVAATVAADVGWRDPAFARLPARARGLTGVASALAIVVRYPGVHLLRALGLQALEQRAVALVRSRERGADRR
jgi:hypothetical protein